MHCFAWGWYLIYKIENMRCMCLRIAFSFQHDNPMWLSYQRREAGTSWPHNCIVIILKLFLFLPLHSAWLHIPYIAVCDQVIKVLKKVTLDENPGAQSRRSKGQWPHDSGAAGTVTMNVLITPGIFMVCQLADTLLWNRLITLVPDDFLPSATIQDFMFEYTRWEGKIRPVILRIQASNTAVTDVVSQRKVSPTLSSIPSIKTSIHRGISRGFVMPLTPDY